MKKGTLKKSKAEEKWPTEASNEKEREENKLIE